MTAAEACINEALLETFSKWYAHQIQLKFIHKN